MFSLMSRGKVQRASRGGEKEESCSLQEAEGCARCSSRRGGKGSGKTAAVAFPEEDERTFELFSEEDKRAFGFFLEERLRSLGFFLLQEESGKTLGFFREESSEIFSSFHGENEKDIRSAIEEGKDDSSVQPRLTCRNCLMPPLIRSESAAMPAIPSPGSLSCRREAALGAVPVCRGQQHPEQQHAEASGWELCLIIRALGDVVTRTGGGGAWQGQQ
ncbi:hypothetical protein KM043_009265 [Ampulex compressa]|nr:hypothetical protein KM043_009265 [Ampulex compressa]